jgi:hypothetical protein
MICPLEVEDTRARYVQRDVEFVRFLVEKMAGIGSSVVSLTIVGTAHVGPDSDPVVCKPVPHAIGIESNRNYGRLI